jgi:catechol 2,3-dioxygenase-like lactoylglutathione lyase family enzyme
MTGNGPATRQKEHIVITSSRLQLALNVTDIDAATTFYRDLFGIEPAKQRPGYANFEIADPPLKLVLFHNPGASSPLNHLGVELATTAQVGDAAARFATAGLPHRMTEADRCCHAVQDKVWVDAPDVPLGAWEFYTVLADDPEPQGASGTCCTPSGPSGGQCCAGGAEES